VGDCLVFQTEARREDDATPDRRTRGGEPLGQTERREGMREP